VPRWLIALVAVLFIVAQFIADSSISGCWHRRDTWAPELRNDPVASTAGLMAIITLASAFLAAYIF